MIIVKMEKSEDIRKIMIRKENLKRGIFIKDDLMKKKREVQRRLKEQNKRKRKEIKDVKVIRKFIWKKGI